MIDSIFQVVQTILNKEIRGNVTPSEFNLLATQVQNKIFRGYFDDVNRDKNKENKGLTNKNFAHLSFIQRQRIEQFAASAVNLTYNATPQDFSLPTDIYYIKDRGITTAGEIVVDEVESSDIPFLTNSLVTPTTTFPVYERLASTIRVFPLTIITGVDIRYLRIPKDPKWTFTVVSGIELFDNTKSDFQEFELHDSEFSNIVIEMVSLFGINLREVEVARYAEVLKQKQDIKEEG